MFLCLCAFLVCGMAGNAMFMLQPFRSSARLLTAVHSISSCLVASLSAQGTGYLMSRKALDAAGGFVGGYAVVSVPSCPWNVRQ